MITPSNLKVTVCSIVVPPMTTGRRDAPTCFFRKGDVHRFCFVPIDFYEVSEGPALQPPGDGYHGSMTHVSPTRCCHPHVQGTTARLKVINMEEEAH